MAEQRYHIILVVAMDIGGRSSREEAAQAALNRISPHVEYAEVIEGLCGTYERADELAIKKVT